MSKKVTLKRSLFIGLGGTGAAALLQTKKRFLDTYGEIPPMIGFLSIDTDGNTEIKSIPRENIVEGNKVRDNNVSFDKSELIYAQVRGAKETYERQKDTLFSWMPPENVYAIKSMMNGAGQVRTNGRFAIHNNYNSIINSVTSKINSLLQMNIMDNDKFQAKGKDIEINFVYSIGGGTGAGTFIDIAYLVKEAIGTANNTTSTAFMVLPDVFNVMQTGVSMENVRPNGYGALKDLDFLMQNDVEKLNLTLEYQDKTIEIKSNPFDVVFTINNKNSIGETLSDVKEISEQIGLAMFTGASELSANINSAYDNVMTILNGGKLDIENKKAWAGSMGVSELFYDGNTLGNIYARKAIASMISNLTTETNSSQKLADEFIDAPEISIRENDGNDYLIDALLAKSPKVLFPEINEIEDVKNSISLYLNDIKSTGLTRIEENYKNKYSNVSQGLKTKINEVINTDSGVANTKEFLDGLIGQLENFLYEMIEEEKELKENQRNLDLQNQSELDYLANNIGFSSIFKKGEINVTKQSLGENTNQQAVLINEILRRQYAQKFLNELKNEVNNHLKNIKTLIQRLSQVKEQALSKARNLQNSVNAHKKTFVIDLHHEEINKIHVYEEDYIIHDFINSLISSNKLYDLYAIDDGDVIEDYFWKYAKKLNKALKYNNINIDEVISKLPEEKRNEIAKQMISKSNALWNYDVKGYKVGHTIHNDFVIGLPSENSSFKDAFKTITNLENISFVHTGVKNRIVCYRMETAVPIYAVNDVPSYGKAYKLSNMSHHIDNNWFNKMEREEFSIWPEEKEDNSIEAWVLGFVYGFIKFEEEKYQIQSKKKGVPRKKYWIDLSDYRDEAYDVFVKNNYISEMIELVENERKQSGEEVTKTLINDVINNYNEKYSQINLSDKDLDKKEFAKIADLIDKEIDFTVNELSILLK